MLEGKIHNLNLNNGKLIKRIYELFVILDNMNFSINFLPAYKLHSLDIYFVPGVNGLNTHTADKAVKCSRKFRLWVFFYGFSKSNHYSSASS